MRGELVGGARSAQTLFANRLAAGWTMTEAAIIGGWCVAERRASAVSAAGVRAADSAEGSTARRWGLGGRSRRPRRRMPACRRRALCAALRPAGAAGPALGAAPNHLARRWTRRSSAWRSPRCSASSPRLGPAPCRGRRHRRARQRHRRGAARLGRLEAGTSAGMRRRRRARAAPARLDAQALRLRWPSSAACPRRPACSTIRPAQIATIRRPVPAAELRPRLGLGVRSRWARA